MTDTQLMNLAQTHGLRVNGDGHVWGHVNALGALVRAVVHAENRACKHAVGEGAGIMGHGECAEIIRRRRQA